MSFLGLLQTLEMGSHKTGGNSTMSYGSVSDLLFDSNTANQMCGANHDRRSSYMRGLS